ncbi:MAG TPA: cellulase family glycosylhydrolase [Chitinophagaceae bacterium]|nr:cellulase family glycosylhydrolase [Chitinophagaceae bacterium]
MKTYKTIARGLKACFFIALVVAFTSSYSQTFLRASGSKIIDASNNEVILRGMGLGGWLLMEGYMLQVDGGFGQWQIKREMYLQGASPSEIESFFTGWRANNTTAADIAYLKSLGLNCIRLPMHYDLFLTAAQRAVRDNVAFGTTTVTNYVESLSTWYDQNVLFTDLTVPGFTTINNTLQWAGANGMWVVLDLHAAPGGQGTDANISDALVGLDLYNRVDSKGRKIYQLVLERLWKAISNQYKTDARVAMYDILNEPHGNIASTALKTIYDNVIAAIRSNGDNHLILLEGRGYGNEYTGLTPDLFPGQTNLVWNGHRYWVTNDPTVKDRNANQLNLIANLVNFRTKWNVPVWVGETGENSNHWTADACKNLNDRGIGWCLWTHKRLRGTYNGVYEQTASPMKVEHANIYTPAGRTALLQNVQFANCVQQQDVVDAMTRMVNDASPVPFKGTRITLPGKVFAADFDLGRNGVSYNDEIYQKIPYNGSGWNNGYSYRNDGVDIEATQDATGNGVNVGWIGYLEWMNYSVNVTQSGNYSVQFRVANGDARKIGALTLKVDGNTIGTINVPLTGGWQTWNTITLPGTVSLSAGNHTVQVACNSRNGGGNLSWISFTTASGVKAATNVMAVYPNPVTQQLFIPGLRAQARISITDAAGKIVLAERAATANRVDVAFLKPGPYFLKIRQGNNERVQQFIKE